MRTRRIALAVLLATGMSTLQPQPARAEGGGAGIFSVKVGLVGGLGHACHDARPDLETTATKGQKSCPPDVETSGTLQKMGKFVTIDGNIRTGTITATVACFGIFVNVDKQNKEVLEQGNCKITGTVTVTGYCGFAQGFGKATITPDGGTPPGSVPLQTYQVIFTFTVGNTNILLRGNYWKGPVTTAPTTREGDVFVFGQILLDAQAANNDCTQKQAHAFLVTAEANFTHPKVLT